MHTWQLSRRVRTFKKHALAGLFITACDFRAWLLCNQELCGFLMRTHACLSSGFMPLPPVLKSPLGWFAFLSDSRQNVLVGPCTLCTATPVCHHVPVTSLVVPVLIDRGSFRTLHLSCSLSPTDHVQRGCWLRGFLCSFAGMSWRVLSHTHQPDTVAGAA